MGFKNIFVPNPAVGDPRWKSHNPIRVLWGIITTSAISLLVYGPSFDILITAPIQIWFILVSALDLMLFFKHRLRPTYAVSIASLWSFLALSFVVWHILVVVYATLYSESDTAYDTAYSVYDPVYSVIIRLIIAVVSLALYLSYLMLAVKVFRPWKHGRKQKLSPDGCEAGIGAFAHELASTQPGTVRS